VSLEDLAELFANSKSFPEFQERLGKLCDERNISPIGGRYLEDASFEDGWLTAFFGGSNQLQVSLNPERLILRAKYTNGQRSVCASYDDTTGDLTWEIPPENARDAVRILQVIATLAELDSKTLIEAYLPQELNNEEAQLYMRVPSWPHLWINPTDLKNILPVR
jgi:hypothetical protein